MVVEEHTDAEQTVPAETTASGDVLVLKGQVVVRRIKRPVDVCPCCSAKGALESESDADEAAVVLARRKE